MIKIDYLIRRNEGDKFSEFEPNLIPLDLPLLSYVQGPNSSGKSTLLNLIALGFFGSKLSTEELNPDLKQRIDALSDSDHQQVKFKIEVNNEMLGVKFITEKKELDKKTIVVTKIANGDDAPISYETFKREYKLIYDIPNNPLGRLPLLLNTLRDQQKDIGADIAKLRDTVRNIIDQIKESKNPERIKDMKVKIKENEAFLNEHKQKEIDQIKKIHKVREYFYARYINHYSNLQTEATEQYKELKKRINSGIKSQNKKYQFYMQLTQQLDENMKLMETLIDSIRMVLPKIIEPDQKYRYELWKKADIRDEIYYPDIYNNLLKETAYFIKHLEHKVDDDKINLSQDLNMRDLLKTLIAVLVDYKDNEITIPGINLPIQKFLNALEENLSELEETTSMIDSVEECKQSLNRLKELLESSIDTAKSIKQRKDIDQEEFEEFSLFNDLEELDNKIKSYGAKIEYFNKSAIKNDFDPKVFNKKHHQLEKDPDNQFYATFTEKQFEDKLSEFDKKLIDLQAAILKIERRLEDYREDLITLESKEPHKYQDKFPVIQKLLIHIQNLERLFHDNDSWIAVLIKNPEEFTNLSKHQSAYADCVGQYLAKKIGRIKHISNTYRVTYVDVILKLLKTEKGAIIHFSDLGTGQGQAAYLETLLNMSENKKIIALFDEVAMMDENTLKPIMEKLRNLYYEKKLLMAIIVQKGNNVSVEDILCSPD